LFLLFFPPCFSGTVGAILGAELPRNDALRLADCPILETLEYSILETLEGVVVQVSLELIEIATLGSTVGRTLGESLGSNDGTSEGSILGPKLGSTDTVGEPLTDGELDG